ncbi:hypothetical protein NA57DRAFT_45042 [Rhizodiscina lignyota]|uniref:7alpha-cephem-methoxylase P8 chain related protein n=1 Tax=Rhizodiscina lignyota TaxID=1504668 RepID=A0A9P4M5E6_9PEZI|nr:hypothetical protein NA57DRAFT_45042 [Rhizodiscina lignyota]
MASAAVQLPPSAPHLNGPLSAVGVETKGAGPRDVVTKLNYYKDPGDGSPPVPSYVGKPDTYNRPVDTRTVTVHDVRGRETEPHLDTTGFQFLKHESIEKDFTDDEQIKKQYYPEVEQLLKDTTGAKRVFIFDHTIRRPQAAGENPLRGPVQRVHIDQSYSASEDRVRYHFPEDYHRLLNGRFQIINLWRPIKTVQRDPLAVAAAHSVEEKDLIPVALIYPSRRGETYTVLPNEKHDWYYLSGQRPDEPLLIKCFDSEKDGRARRIPHTAFEIEGTQDKEARESIEVRCLVFFQE